MKIGVSDHTFVFNEGRGSPHITGRAAAGPKKIIIHDNSKRVAPIYSIDIKIN